MYNVKKEKAFYIISFRDLNVWIFLFSENDNVLNINNNLG